MSDRTIICKYCGARIVYDPQVRTPSSAWSAPDAEDPTACLSRVPGHAPRYDGPVGQPPRGY